MYTKHAINRTKERFNDNVYYSVKLLLELGYRKEDFRKGSSLRKYINKKQSKSEAGTICIVYNKKVFIIRGNTIITTWKIPDKYLDGYLWDDDSE